MEIIGTRKLMDGDVTITLRYWVKTRMIGVTLYYADGGEADRFMLSPKQTQQVIGYLLSCRFKSTT